MSGELIRIELGEVYNNNDYDELARMFLPRGSYELVARKASVFEGVPAKLEKARGMYGLLAEQTGRTLPWGVLTGVKPTKLFAQLADSAQNSSETGGLGSLPVKPEDSTPVSGMAGTETDPTAAVHYARSFEPFESAGKLPPSPGLEAGNSQPVSACKLPPSQGLETGNSQQVSACKMSPSPGLEAGNTQPVSACKLPPSTGLEAGNSQPVSACKMPPSQLDCISGAAEILRGEYLVSPEKIELLKCIYERERAILPPLTYGGAEEAARDERAGLPAGGAVSVYIGIPFCPTRCAYCTFTSCTGTEKQMGAYLEALYEELSYVAEGMRRRGMIPECVYIGGGTPTALTTSMLEELLARVNVELAPGGKAEFTVEAGRPDTITFEKASCIARAGAGRISVNPQTMNDSSLVRIGRRHTAADTEAAFENVRAAGIKAVNADIIAGLPGEDAGDFSHTVERILKLAPENVTVHTLALKKGSALRENDPYYSYIGDGAAGEGLRIAGRRLTEAGMAPYYLYRQKQTVGNLENTGYAAPGAECLYNMRMMQEKQTVIAMGAGAVSKLYFPAEDRVERVFNMADTGLYIERIGEMKERKRKLFG